MMCVKIQLSWLKRLEIRTNEMKIRSNSFFTFQFKVSPYQNMKCNRQISLLNPSSCNVMITRIPQYQKSLKT